jgi:hypothetical protein
MHSMYAQHTFRVGQLALLQWYAGLDAFTSNDAVWQVCCGGLVWVQERHTLEKASRGVKSEHGAGIRPPTGASC